MVISVKLSDERFDREFNDGVKPSQFRFFNRYFMKALLKHTGESQRIQLTLPRSLVKDIDSLMSSRSLFMTMALEQYFSENNMLDTKIPPLNPVFNVLMMQRLALKGSVVDGDNYYRNIQARSAFLKRWRRALDSRIAELVAMEAEIMKYPEVTSVQTLDGFYGSYHVKNLFKYAGESGHFQVTIPKYLLKYVDYVTDSRSSFVAVLIDDWLRKKGRRSGNTVSLSKLFNLMVERRASLGGYGASNAHLHPRLQARHLYFKRHSRYLDVLIAEVSGNSTKAMKLPPRVKVQRPYVRIRKSRTDSESERELGPESETWREKMLENPEAMRDLFHNNPELFKEKFPDTWEEWHSESDAAYEEEEEEPLGN